MVNFTEKLQALNTNIKTTFKTTRDNTEAPLLNVLYDITKTNSAVMNIVILDSAPGMKEFKSERRPGMVTGTTQTIAPRKWEGTLDVKREDVEDDELGRVPAATRKMAVNSKRHYGALSVEALMKGFTATLNDGVAFFATSRGNLQTGALTADNFKAARLKLTSQTDSKGDNLGYLADTLIVGPQNQAAAEQIIKAQTIEGTTNTLYNSVEIKVDPRITDTSWYVVDTKEGVYPLTIAERVPADKMVAKDDLNSDRAFDKDIFSWGLRGRYDAAYVEPKLIVGSTGA